MWESIVLSAAAVSHSGKTGSENGGNFYLNGQYMIDSDFGNVRTSMENSGSQFLFAVCQDMGGKSKEASNAIIAEMKRLHGEYETSIISIEERARQVQECFDVTSNLLKIFEGPRKPVFAAIVVYHMKVSVYGVGRGSVILYRNKQMSAPDHLSGQELKVGDTFIMGDRVLLEQLGAETMERVMATAKTPAEAVNMFYAEIFNSDYNDDINLVVVKAVKTSGESTIAGVKDNYVEPEESEEQFDYSKKLVKYYDKRQETLRTVIASILTIIILLAVGFTVYKILTGTGGDNTNVNANKTTLQASVSAAKSAAPSASSSTSTTPAPSQQASAQPSATPAQTGDYTLYTIKSGDTLVSICGDFYKDESKYVKVMEYNGITDATKIQVGQVIKLPKL